MTDYDTIGKMYVIPQYPDNRELLLAVDRRTKEFAKRKFSLYVEYDWECNTIATITLNTLIKILYMNVTGTMAGGLDIVQYDEEHNPYIDLLGLLKIEPTSRRNLKAEKIGSINCKFTPGAKVNSIIEDDRIRETVKIDKVETETYYLTGDEEKDAAWEKTDQLIRSTLADTYGILLKHHFSAIAITDAFLENLYRELLMRLANSDHFHISTIVNDYFEISAIAFNNPDGSIGVTFTMTPGKYGKLNIKSDLTTEADD